jgi:hypothetical protein
MNDTRYGLREVLNSTMSLACLLAAVAVLALSSSAQDDDALKKDLTAVIALHGRPCGEVIAAKVLAENDYAASCKDGHSIACT